ncbi:MAG: ATP-binding cassette domain-containing protein [Endozoicomonadaceae bacterium]|nr:ATP-binding cassette domain-containing protein [Endozoicomonadaceae bacterium]
MRLIHFNQVSAAYGAQPLLDKADLQITTGERICLIGRNGAGKSTLMKIAAGMLLPDEGDIWKKQGLRIGMLSQDLPVAADKSVYSVIAGGLAETGELLDRWHTLSHAVTETHHMAELERIQEKLEKLDGWSFQQKIEQITERLGLNPDVTIASLSGGEKRRVELGRALINEPELLLLDEPTNHMDILTINWLEKQLSAFRGALLFITHDRAFLRALATRIVELDRGHLTNWECNYNTYLERKAHQLAVEEAQNAEFDKKLAKEEVWIRQGIKARRTRNEGRVRALQALRAERAERRQLQGKAKLLIENKEHSGKRVAELSDICHGYDGRMLIDQFDFCLMRGDKVGLIGSNGSGKSTLLKIILGDLSPQQGQVQHGTKLKVAYFDQMRAQLDLEKTVIDNVAEGRERITVNGKERHIISYLGDFLFPAERAQTPVKALSGGERNRLLLARLFSKPANLLVMDEPTNDLDVETLELLENLLVEFSGTLLLVSHDRDFLDNVVSSVLVLEGEGKITEYVGGFSDWLRQGGSLQLLEGTSGVNSSKEKKSKNKPTTEKKDNESVPAKKKLSYKLQRELDALPDEIEKLEIEIEQLKVITSAADFYAQDQQKVQQTLQRLSYLTAELDKKIERWTELAD